MVQFDQLSQTVAKNAPGLNHKITCHNYLDGNEN